MQKGFQQEDSITISEKVARYLYQQCEEKILEFVYGQEEKDQIVLIENPVMKQQKIHYPNKNMNFGKISKDGLPIIGKFYEKGDVILGKIVKKIETQQNQKLESFYEDDSVEYEFNEPGQVVDIIKQKQENGKKTKIILKIKKFLVPTIGDKYTSRTG